MRAQRNPVNLAQLIKVKNKLLDQMEADLGAQSFASQEAFERASESYQRAIMNFFVTALEEIIDPEGAEQTDKAA